MLMNFLAAVLAPLALSNPAPADPTMGEVETDVVATIATETTDVGEETANTEETIVFQSNEVVQPAPDYAAVWLDGQVSFVGGELSSSERQYMYATANDYQFMRSDSQYRQAIAEGYLVRLQHPDLVVAARRPYVLPSTAAFIYEIAEAFRGAGCSGLRVNDATRLLSERPSNGSVHSVHPAGMALDLRVINLDVRCYQVLSELLHDAEAALRTDTTRENRPPHFHIVVLPAPPETTTDLVARYPQPEQTGGQDE